MRNKGQFKKGHHWRKPKPWWDREWLALEYIKKQRSAADIAKDYNVGETAIHYWLKKHGIKTRNVSEARKIKYWGLSGSDNPMWNRRGELNPRWKGGISPERQRFYSSYEWKAACSKVWVRDKAECQRCNLKKDDQSDMPFHIHHIEPFDNIKLRAEVSNLVLLCEVCHHFIHSKRNILNEFLPKGVQ